MKKSSRGLWPTTFLTAGVCCLMLTPSRIDAQQLDQPVNSDEVRKLTERLDRVEKQNEELQQQLRLNQQKLDQEAERIRAASDVKDQPSTAVDEKKVHEIVEQYLMSTGKKAPDGEIVPGQGYSASATADGPDQLGLKSRGVFETSIIRRLRGENGTGGWDDGFYLRSPDASYYLRIGGDFQFDYRGFPDSHDQKDIDSFLVRKARLSADGILAKYYDFRLMVDFSNAQSSSATTASARILDAYGNIHYWDEFQVQLGKYKQPFSFEQLILDRYAPFAERSLIDQLVPAREPGVMLHGEFLFNDRLDYAVSLSNGEINGDYDTNNRKDFVGRVVMRPFNGSWYVDWLHRLQFGVDGTIGIEQESLSGLSLKTPGTIPFFAFNNLTTVGTTTTSNVVFADGRRTRFAPEVSYFYRGLGCAASYYYQQQEYQLSGTGPASSIVRNVPSQGFYAFATLFLTGEERTAYTQPIDPIRPFDPRTFSGLGAFELTGRVSRLELGGDVFKPFIVGTKTNQAVVELANPLLYSRGATEMTLGLNWYLNRWVKWEVNFEYDWFDQPVTLGPTPANRVRHDEAVLVQFQISF